ncbi:MULTISPECIES: acetyl-CoA carboxylase biotin carboxyl carrier protein [Allobacillus]|uniref:Biotin carboxyl carrier protein of acetyl-CoA carboxylase n=1 Tax=Allobacillus salarius TaxID=1955272 RepID=A0A556PTF4_9BACI|nr:acetyl-CoA carboxylase biotin carboxyl carrier protein [Allobacillus salarius]TSJ67663.1 acetyl-CoA carboxylase biotin carboxyl carrier protein [Allobacillus salarius]
MLKVQEIRELIKLIDESSITEFKYETENAEVHLKKATGEVQAAPVVQPSVAQRTEQQASVPTVEKSESANQTEKATDESSEKQEETATHTDYDHEITSPMVGTFYAAPSPEEGPYVNTGDRVEASSIVCIVEAMKLFNEIEAEVNGEIVEILVEDGELVEYGQPLFRIKKA